MRRLEALADKMLDLIVPKVEAGACKERHTSTGCPRGWFKICYYGCGGGAFCTSCRYR